MTHHTPQDTQPSNTRDDGYWSTLFEQAESLSPEHQPVPETAVPWPAPDMPPPPLHLNNQTRKHPSHKNPWEQAAEIVKNDEIIECVVSGYNKGGLLINWETLQGFIPASQLVDFPQFHVESERIQALKSWLGKSLQVRIIELNPTINRLIFSERAALVDSGERDDLLNRLQPGKRVEGTITNLTNFGAFVDLGGVEGLIHISELSWSRVTHPSRVVRPQQIVTVLVLSVDAETQRVALSLKRLRRDPWQGVEDRYQAGQLVTGTISNVVSFGAFVHLEDELEGLIHISELAEGSFLHPRSVVRQGDTVTAKVLAVNGKEKRLSLSLRQIATSNGHQ